MLLAQDFSGPLALAFAATRPERVNGLVLLGSFARLVNGPGYDAGLAPELRAAAVEVLVDGWGVADSVFNGLGCPGPQRARQREKAARVQRLSSNRSEVEPLVVAMFDRDVTGLLGDVRAGGAVAARRRRSAGAGDAQPVPRRAAALGPPRRARRRRALPLLRARDDGPRRDLHVPRGAAGPPCGDVDRRSDGDIAGFAVHTAQRVQSEAAPGEVLVTTTVRDLVAGSGLAFSPRGARDLRGTGRQVELFALDAGNPRHG